MSTVGPCVLEAVHQYSTLVFSPQSHVSAPCNTPPPHSHLKLKAAVAREKGQTSVLRHLLASHGKTERNISFRRSLFFSAFASRLSLLVPVFVLWQWGLSAIVSVSDHPPEKGKVEAFRSIYCLRRYSRIICTLSAGVRKGNTEESLLVVNQTVQCVAMLKGCIAICCTVWVSLMSGASERRGGGGYLSLDRSGLLLRAHLYAAFGFSEHLAHSSFSFSYTVDNPHNCDWVQLGSAACNFVFLPFYIFEDYSCAYQLIQVYLRGRLCPTCRVLR